MELFTKNFACFSKKQYLCAVFNFINKLNKQLFTMLIEANPYKVFAGSKGGALAERLCEYLGISLGKVNIEHFSDGEFTACFEESVRGQSVYLVQSTCPSTDNLMELLLMIDAARRASAYKIIAVIPYFGWARQDRKDRPRVAIGAKLVANMIQSAGADRVITLDLHADQIQGFFNVPVDHLYASSVFVPFIRSLNLEDLVIASPDVGGSKRASTYAKHLEAPLVLCHKTREKANVVSDMRIIGDVKGKNVVIIDDMADTAGTLCKAANLMMENGAKSVRAVVTHPVLSGKAYENLNNSALEELICTDSIPCKEDECKKIHVISIAGIFADAIQSVYNNQSISSHYLL